MTKINVSQICKIFNGSCSIKDFIRNDQLIMKCMTKSAISARFTNWLFQPCTLPKIQTQHTILPVSFFSYLNTFVLQIFKRIVP